MGVKLLPPTLTGVKRRPLSTRRLLLKRGIWCRDPAHVPVSISECVAGENQIVLKEDMEACRRCAVVECAGMDYPVHRGDTMALGLHDRMAPNSQDGSDE
ncbi:kelch-like protein 13 isoform X2 [Tachysurus ichikawai]